MLNPDRSLRLAAQVAGVAERLGIKTALIGAAALAVHGYARGTVDIDLAVCLRSTDMLRDLAQELRACALDVEIRWPDADDPLGGVLVVRYRDDDESSSLDVVEVVNFVNPFRLSGSPAQAALGRAFPLVGVRMLCVSLPDLVALKLYAGGSVDLADIVQVIACNPDLDLEEVRAVASSYDTGGRLESLFAEAAISRKSR